jgi:eukaryotic-like serine/threonine-protein kinase
MAEGDGRGWNRHPQLIRLIRPLTWWGQRKWSRIEEGDPAKALSVAEDSLAALIKVFGPDGGPTAAGRAKVAHQLERLDRYAEAQLMWQDVVESNRHYFGDDDMATVSAESRLAHVLGLTGQIDIAIPLARQVYNVYLRDLGPEHKATIRAREMLTALGDHEGIAE